LVLKELKVLQVQQDTLVHKVLKVHREPKELKELKVM
jgi:hypothetical protein